jgi:hypothetical protein
MAWIYRAVSVASWRVTGLSRPWLLRWRAMEPTPSAAEELARQLVRLYPKTRPGDDSSISPRAILEQPPSFPRTVLPPAATVGDQTTARFAVQPLTAPNSRNHVPLLWPLCALFR